MTPFTRTVRAWSRASNHAVSSLLEANRATMAAFGLANESAVETDDSARSVEYDRPGWSSDRSVETPDEIEVGDSVQFTKTLAREDVEAFAHVSGDTNRLHLDEAFAADGRFDERIAHGTLVSGLISAALARLPGVTVYLSQDLEFLAPVSIGDRVTATAAVVEALGDDRYRLETTVESDGEEVVVGEAVVLVDSLPGETGD